MDEHMRVVEINGVKMEVDLRTPRVIENFKVGDSIKVLRKKYSGYEVLPAAIVGFVEFTNLPSIEILTIDRQGQVEFLTFNAETKDVEIAPFNRYELLLDRAEIMDKLDGNVQKAQEVLRLAEAKRHAFVETIGKAFGLSVKEESHA
jgi:hypothetical protein